MFILLKSSPSTGKVITLNLNNPMKLRIMFGAFFIIALAIFLTILSIGIE